MLPCKICEKEVHAEKLSLHSQKCRDVFESKELLTSIIARMEAIGEQALAMKNSLETNAAKEKKKQTKKSSFKDLLDLGSHGHQRSSSSSQSGTSPLRNQLAGDNEVLNTEGDRMDSSAREHLSTRETVDNQDDTPSSLRMTEPQYRKFVEEVNKSMIVLKKITVYTKNIVDWALETSAMCDVSRNTVVDLEEDEKEIVDENVLKFVRGFITELELYVQTRERYVGSSHELVRVNSPKAYRDLKHKFFTKRSTSIANLKADSGNIKESSFFKRMEECSSAAIKKKESPVVIDKKKLLESGMSSPMLQKRSVLSQMAGFGPMGGSGTPTSVAPSPSMKTLKSDFSKMLLQTNINHVQGGNFMSMANLKKNTEDVTNLRDKIKASLNLNTMEKSTVMAESGLMSPNLAVLNRKKDDKGKGKLTVMTNATLSAFGRKAEQKAQIDQAQVQIQTPKKRTLSQGWFKTLRNEDSKGLNAFGTEESTPKGPTSTNTLNEPIFTVSSAQNSKAKKAEDKPEFVESLRGYYSDCGPSRRKQLLHANSNSQDVSFDDFQIIKFIGKGAYGEVWLVKKKATGDFYAMKTVDWSNKAVQNKLKDIKAEKDIYQALEGDFVVKAFWTFHHENLICFVTEYMLGGDFNRILDRLVRLEEDQAKFYFAELVLAVESLHTLKVVHRDLKPDNILMDAKGHIRLTDFGLSQNEINKYKVTSNPGSRESLSPKLEDPLFQAKSSLNKFCKTPSGSLPKAKVDFKQYANKKSKVVFDFLGKNEYHQVIEKKPILKKVKDSPTQQNKKPKMVGTPDYMAPEIIAPENYELEGYDEKCMDWWSMGVILYQFLVGMPAFCDTSIEAVFDNIKHLRMEWPPIGDEEDCISPEAADLIKQLLNPDPKKRLGAKGCEEVKSHDFFKGIDWKTLREREAPIIPCSLDDEQSTPLQTPKTFGTGVNSPKIVRNNRPKTAKPIDFGAFRMRRLDLLDEANQQTHKDFQRQNSVKLNI